MKIFLLFFVVFTLSTGHHHDKSVVASHQGDGTSVANAVIIKERKSEKAISVEEDAWLAEKYPGYTRISVKLLTTEKVYDIITIKTKEGQQLDVYFDASLFYNRFH